MNQSKKIKTKQQKEEEIDKEKRRQKEKERVISQSGRKLIPSYRHEIAYEMLEEEKKWGRGRTGLPIFLYRNAYIWNPKYRPPPPPPPAPPGPSTTTTITTAATSTSLKNLTTTTTMTTNSTRKVDSSDGGVEKGTGAVKGAPILVVSASHPTQFYYYYPPPPFSSSSSQPEHHHHRHSSPPSLPYSHSRHEEEEEVERKRGGRWELLVSGVQLYPHARIFLVADSTTPFPPSTVVGEEDEDDGLLIKRRNWESDGRDDDGRRKGGGMGTNSCKGEMPIPPCFSYSVDRRSSDDLILPSSSLNFPFYMEPLELQEWKEKNGIVLIDEGEKEGGREGGVSSSSSLWSWWCSYGSLVFPSSSPHHGFPSHPFTSCTFSTRGGWGSSNSEGGGGHEGEKCSSAAPAFLPLPPPSSGVSRDKGAAAATTAGGGGMYSWFGPIPQTSPPLPPPHHYRYHDEDEGMTLHITTLLYARIPCGNNNIVRNKCSYSSFSSRVQLPTSTSATNTSRIRRETAKTTRKKAVPSFSTRRNSLEKRNRNDEDDNNNNNRIIRNHRHNSIHHHFYDHLLRGERYPHIGEDFLEKKRDGRRRREELWAAMMCPSSSDSSSSSRHHHGDHNQHYYDQDHAKPSFPLGSSSLHHHLYECPSRVAAGAGAGGASIPIWGRNREEERKKKNKQQEHLHPYYYPYKDDDHLEEVEDHPRVSYPIRGGEQEEKFLFPFSSPPSQEEQAQQDPHHGKKRRISQTGMEVFYALHFEAYATGPPTTLLYGGTAASSSLDTPVPSLPSFSSPSSSSHEKDGRRRKSEPPSPQRREKGRRVSTRTNNNKKEGKKGDEKKNCLTCFCSGEERSLSYLIHEVFRTLLVLGKEEEPLEESEKGEDDKKPMQRGSENNPMERTKERKWETGKVGGGGEAIEEGGGQRWGSGCNIHPEVRLIWKTESEGDAIGAEKAHNKKENDHSWNYDPGKAEWSKISPQGLHSPPPSPPPPRSFLPPNEEYISLSHFFRAESRLKELQKRFFLPSPSSLSSSSFAFSSSSSSQSSLPLQQEARRGRRLPPPSFSAGSPGSTPYTRKIHDGSVVSSSSFPSTPSLSFSSLVLLRRRLPEEAEESDKDENADDLSLLPPFFCGPNYDDDDSLEERLKRITGFSFYDLILALSRRQGQPPPPAVQMVPPPPVRISYRSHFVPFGVENPFVIHLLFLLLVKPYLDTLDQMSALQKKEEATRGEEHRGEGQKEKIRQGKEKAERGEEEEGQKKKPKWKEEFFLHALSPSEKAEGGDWRMTWSDESNAKGEDWRRRWRGEGERDSPAWEEGSTGGRLSEEVERFRASGVGAGGGADTSPYPHYDHNPPTSPPFSFASSTTGTINTNNILPPTNTSITREEKNEGRDGIPRPLSSTTMITTRGRGRAEERGRERGMEVGEKETEKNEDGRRRWKVPGATKLVPHPFPYFLYYPDGTNHPHTRSHHHHHHHPHQEIITKKEIEEEYFSDRLRFPFRCNACRVSFFCTLLWLQREMAEREKEAGKGESGEEEVKRKGRGGGGGGSSNKGRGDDDRREGSVSSSSSHSSFSISASFSPHSLPLRRGTSSADSPVWKNGVGRGRGGKKSEEEEWSWYSRHKWEKGRTKKKDKISSFFSSSSPPPPLDTFSVDTQELCKEADRRIALLNKKVRRDQKRREEKEKREQEEGKERRKKHGRGGLSTKAAREILTWLSGRLQRVEESKR